MPRFRPLALELTAAIVLSTASVAATRPPADKSLADVGMVRANVSLERAVSCPREIDAAPHLPFPACVLGWVRPPLP